jgi:photosystem II stability/assembly factor-like uncharacterized protein
MRRFRPAVLTLALAALLLGAFAIQGSNGNRVATVHRDRYLETEEGRELLEPADALLARLAVGSDGSDLSTVYRQAIAQEHSLKAKTAAAAPDLAGAQWSLVGPTNIGGRALDLALDPKTPTTVYLATAGGGVWKSTEKGEKLQSIWPADVPQSTGAIAITPGGTLYVGTGETGPGGGSLTYGGNGTYRSTDGGKHWSNIGLRDTSRISRIVIDPSNPRRIFVAATGNLYKGTQDRGIYRSDDGGDSWKRVLAGDNDTTGAADIAIDPKNPKRLLATMWQHQRLPDARNYTGTGSGVYRSTDGGDSWARIGSPFLGPNPELGRMGVAIDPSNPDTVYVIASGTPIGGAHLGFYKSTDFGNSFIPTIDPNNAGLGGAFTYGWWFGRLWVDPNNSQRIYSAGVDLMRSDDGGQSFASAGANAHADMHAMVWDPKVKGRIYLGNDGGLYRSDDDGVAWNQVKYQPFSQPDSLDVSEQDPNWLVAGLQDNGQIRTEKPEKEWNPFGGGDGQRTLISPKDKHTIYGCSQNGACSVSHDDGATQTGFSYADALVVSAGRYASVRHNFFTPIEFDPEDPHTIYIGGDILSRSDDEGQSFTTISPVLGGAPGKETNPLYVDYGTLTTISPAPKSTGTIYAGTDNGALWYTHSGGGLTGWTQATDPDLPTSWITRLQVDPKNPMVAYATYSGLRAGEKAAYVFRTKDGGANWDNISGDLPKIQVSDINVIGDKLVVGTDVGVYATRDQGAHWYLVGGNLPLAPVYELRVNPKSDQLFVATFGRSIWKIGLAALDGIPKVKYTLGLPKRRSCTGTRTLRLRVRQKGVSLKSAKVYVGKKRVATLKGKRLKKTLKLRLPSKRVKVRITAVTKDGQKISASRTYAACKKKRKRG